MINSKNIMNEDSNKNILQVKNLNKTFKEFKLQNINFSLEKGYIMGLIGPNGSGKTTLIKILMGLMKSDSGDISIFGLDKNDKKNCIPIKERIGFVYDENYFYEELTVKATKNFIAPFYKNWNEDKFIQLQNNFNLPENRKVKELSKGMKMKLSLALALAHNPDLIIMDEPTSGLDPVFRSEVLDILRDVIQNEEKGILFSSHITNDLDKIADYITFINNGEMVFSKSKEEIGDEFLLVRGDTTLLESFGEDERDCFISIKKNAFGFDGLSKDPGKVKKFCGDGALYEKASLEDIMVYYARAGEK